MKAIGIVGSPRKNGNSAFLLNLVLENLSNSNFETEVIFLKDLSISPCNECYYCTKEEKCIIEDDMQELYNKLRDANVIILSTPVFMGGITSRLKAFMERTWHLRRGQLKGKIGTYIVVGRRDIGSAINEIEEYLSRLKVIKISGILGYGFKENDIKNDSEALKNAESLSNQIINFYKS
ncbi:MAG: flavodoxin family protein [Promethearchaeota archaeon]